MATEPEPDAKNDTAPLSGETATEEQQPGETVKRQRSRRFTHILEVRDKKSRLRAAIPYLPEPVAWLILVFNLLLPGVGTLFMGVAALLGAPTCSKKPNRCIDFLLNIVCGLLQTITTLVIVGLVWSVFWGMHAVTQSQEKPRPRLTDKTEEGAEKHIYNPTPA